MLSFLTKVEKNEMISDSFKWENRIALLCYLLGIVAFLAGLVLWAWIRFRAVAPIVTGVVGAVFVFGVVLLIRMLIVHDRIANLGLESLRCSAI